MRLVNASLKEAGRVDLFSGREVSGDQDNMWGSKESTKPNFNWFVMVVGGCNSPSSNLREQG